MRRIESEAELAFAALHALLRPGLGSLDALPGPQSAALRGVFGLAGAAAGDGFLVGLAALSVLSELATDGPVLCLVDDAHCLDHASADALLFAARRLDAEGVAMLFVARDEVFGVRSLPELRLGGLDGDAARALLSGRAAHLFAEVWERVFAEAHGNPLALLELPLAVAQPPVLGALPLPQRLQEAYRKEIRAAWAHADPVLVVAAKETGDLTIVLRAAGAAGVLQETGEAAAVAER